MSAVKSNSTNICTTTSQASNSTCCATIEPEKASSDVVDVLIVGAGIGGLVIALCLHRAGFCVRVHERVPVLESIGFVVNLQPFCVKLLHELGLESKMDEIGIRTGKALYHSRNGQLIYQEVRGIDASYNWLTYSMNRGNF